MNILVCNAGSTSLKFKLFSMPEEKVLAEQRMERVTDYEGGIREFLGTLPADIKVDAVGFKTVLSKDHYGVHVIDDEVIKGMENYMVVAPSHNSFYLKAIRTFMKVMPDTPMIGVFETGFHQTMKPESYIYSVPYEWYEKYGLRRFGYHGASHGYIASQLTEKLGEHYRAVSCHLGGSSSLCAICDGKSVETSMGMSLQTGLPHGSRSGDIDPFAVFFMHKYAGLSYEEIEQQMIDNGGLLGISGVSNDLRDIEEAAKSGNERAQLAIDFFIKEIAGYVGRYAAIMGGIDAVAFTGGIGEKSETVREGVKKKLAFLGDIKYFVIPANEELIVVRKAYEKIVNRLKGCNYVPYIAKDRK